MFSLQNVNLPHNSTRIAMFHTSSRLKFGFWKKMLFYLTPMNLRMKLNVLSSWMGVRAHYFSMPKIVFLYFARFDMLLGKWSKQSLLIELLGKFTFPLLRFNIYGFYSGTTWLITSKLLKKCTRWLTMHFSARTSFLDFDCMAERIAAILFHVPVTREMQFRFPVRSWSAHI